VSRHRGPCVVEIAADCVPVRRGAEGTWFATAPPMPAGLQGRRPLVSFVIIGRNDDYMGDYLYRLGTSLSFLAQSAERAGLLDQVEVLVVDWASERPLAADLPLTSAARRHDHISSGLPESVGSRDGTARWHPRTCAVNVGRPPRPRRVHHLHPTRIACGRKRRWPRWAAFFAARSCCPCRLRSSSATCGATRCRGRRSHRRPHLDE